MKAGSNLEKVLESGRFAVTAEIGPPAGADAESLRRHAALLEGCADAFNLTDNQTANVKMSSVASAAVLLQEGLEPVVQMTCRDRNRIALQSDILGAAGARGQEHTLPVRRPSDVRQPEGGEERLRHRFHSGTPHIPQDAGRGEGLGRRFAATSPRSSS